MRTARTNGLTIGILAAAVVVGAGGWTPAHAQARLRWDFSPGQTLRYEVVQKTSGKIKRGEQTIETTNEWTATVAWSVKAVEPSETARIGMKVQRVRLLIRSAGLKVEYDTQKPSNKDETFVRPFHEVYSSVLGADYSLKLSARGELIEAKVPETVLRAVANSPFVALAESPGVLSESGLKNLFAQFVPVFPGKSIKPGDRWTGTVESPAPPLRMIVSLKDELIELSDKSAKVRVSCDTAIHADPKVPFAVKLTKQQGAGEMSFDRKAGRLTSSALKQSLEMVQSCMNQENTQSVVLDARMSLVP